METNPNYPTTETINLEDHTKLLYRLAADASRRWGGGVERWLGETWIAMNEAAHNYDSKKGRFSTYATKYTYWKLHRINKFENGYRYKGKDYFKPTFFSNVELIVTYDKEVFDSRYKALHPELQEVIDLLLRGWQKQEIAKSLNISSTTVTYRIKRIVELLTQEQVSTDPPPDWKRLQKKSSQSGVSRGSRKSSD